MFAFFVEPAFADYRGCYDRTACTSYVGVGYCGFAPNAGSGYCACFSAANGVPVGTYDCQNQTPPGGGDGGNIGGDEN
jgi:hypothetical protein